MKETERNDQRDRDTVTDPKRKDTGLKGDDADMSKNSTVAVDDEDETVTDSDKSKEYDDTDHEHRYKTPGNEVKNNETGDVETEMDNRTSKDQNTNENK